MKRLLSLVVQGLVLAGCSGHDPVTTPTETPTPATLAIAAGDQQSAPIGAQVPTQPAVLVKDRSGAPMAGVGVTFAVESGGGSVAGGNVTTGGDGVARAGSWVLGPGANRLRASAGSLAPVYFSATGTGPIPLGQGNLTATGGTITVSRPGDAADGLLISVPANALSAATSWSVSEDTTIHVPLKPGFSLVAPPIIVKNGTGYASVNMTLRMPLRLPRTQAVVPFFFDPATGALEPVPLVERTDTTATLATRHFSASLMATRIAKPSAAPASHAAAGAQSAFGEVVMVWVAAPVESLIGLYESGFRAGVDNWEFINYGDWLNPGGFCEGVSLTELYYYYFQKPLGGRPLYHSFDTSLPNQWDNVQGMRLASVVQADFVESFDGGKSLQMLMEVAQNHDIGFEALQEQWILLSIKLLGQPVLLRLQANVGAHAVVAYAVRSDGTHTEVTFADPNFPTNERRMSFDHGRLTPFQVSLTAGEPLALFNHVYPMAVSTEVALGNLEARWNEFANHRAGEGIYPAAYEFQVNSSANGTKWFPITTTVRTATDSLRFRIVCPTCGSIAPHGPGEGFAQVWTLGGDQGLSDGVDPFKVGPGAGSYLLVGEAPTLNDDPARWAFLDTKAVSTEQQPMTLTVATGMIRPGVPARFTLQHNGLAVEGSVFKWTFGDGATATTLADTLSHTFANGGVSSVKVRLEEPSGWVVGERSISIAVGNTPAWRLTSFESNGSGSVTDGCSPATLNSLNTLMSKTTQLLAHPSDGLIFTSPWKLTGIQSKVYLQVAPLGQGATATGQVANWFYFSLGGIVGTIAPTSFNARTTDSDALRAENEALLGLAALQTGVNGFPTGGTNLFGFMTIIYNDGSGHCLFNGNFVYTATLVAGIY